MTLRRVLIAASAGVMLSATLGVGLAGAATNPEHVSTSSVPLCGASPLDWVGTFKGLTYDSPDTFRLFGYETQITLQVTGKDHDAHGDGYYIKGPKRVELNLGSYVSATDTGKFTFRTSSAVVGGAGATGWENYPIQPVCSGGSKVTFIKITLPDPISHGTVNTPPTQPGLMRQG